MDIINVIEKQHRLACTDFVSIDLRLLYSMPVRMTVNFQWQLSIILSINTNSNLLYVTNTTRVVVVLKSMIYGFCGQRSKECTFLINSHNHGKSTIFCIRKSKVNEINWNNTKHEISSYFSIGSTKS